MTRHESRGSGALLRQTEFADGTQPFNSSVNAELSVHLAEMGLDPSSINRVLYSTKRREFTRYQSFRNGEIRKMRSAGETSLFRKYSPASCGGINIVGRREFNTTITLYGDIENDPEKWWEWYGFASDTSTSLNQKPNYCSYSSESYDPGKVMPITDKIVGDLHKLIFGDKEMRTLELLSLPENYRTAFFDYSISMTRAKLIGIQLIYVSMDAGVFDRINDLAGFMANLKQFINFQSGRIFEMKKMENSFFYAAKANEPSYYTSLKIVKDF